MTAASDKARLFPKLQALHEEQGKTWNEVEDVLRGEGYDLSANALRKRYTRWKKSETPSKALVESEPESTQERQDYDFNRFQKTRMESYSKGFEEAEPAAILSPEDAIAGLIDLNKKLVEQVRESNSLMKRLEKRIEEQETKTSHTEHTDEQPVTTRDLLELLKEFMTRREEQMRYIEENKEYDISREEVQELIEKSVEDRVDAELKLMLSEEGGFSQELTHLVDQRLRILFSRGEPVPQAAHAGPGRGKKGKTHKKFSASLEEGLFERVKSLPGQFSGHLSNALEAYLSVVEEKKPE